MSRGNTNTIKGFFLLLVFLSHFKGYVKLNGSLDMHYFIVNRYMGQLIVAMFLFYSGYGVLESLKRKKGYVDTMPKNRILKTIFNFDLAIILYVIVNHILGRVFDKKVILLSFLGWEGIGNSNWYIFAIVILYAITWISFKAFEDKHFAGILATTVLSVFFILFMSRHKQAYWYDTVLCYVAGMWFSYYKKQIEEFVVSNKASYWFLVIAVGVCYFNSYPYRTEIVGAQFWAVSFALLIVLLTMKVSFNNKMLAWVGENLFGLYILQRIPMLMLRHYGLAAYNPYVYFGVSLIVCLVIGYGFNKFCGWSYKKIAK
ncbi:MAG: acyltransferase family protein [bacterium]|nr:acyltransferase family protein [bacterium]